MRNKIIKFFKVKKGYRSFALYFLFFVSGALVAGSTKNNFSSRTKIQTFPVQHYSGFSLQYDSKNKIPLWTYEQINQASLNRVASRSSMSFQKDSAIYPLHQSSNRDYQKSGFDRGHMIPAADQQHSKESLEKTFLFSNICPQNPTLNRGLWAKLEQQTRDMVKNNSNVEVITGPLFLSSIEGNKRFVKYQVIGKNEVAVPTHFFKLICSNNQKIAFIIPNQTIDSKASLGQFEVPISTLEKCSGIAFQFN
ncbi:MAG: hypothetical protein S4CHLAM6_02580 [Chlamydiae bacterium]|nr:hypothetical protein [Chlamydiota bacterium]